MQEHFPVLTRRMRSGVNENKFNHLIQNYEKKLHKPIPALLETKKRVHAHN